MNLKSNKAITLVALIITIIILLILAGVSLSMVLGDNGLINKAQSSVDKYQESANNEQLMLDSIEEYIESKLKKDGELTLSETSGNCIYPNTLSFTVTNNKSGGTLSVTSSDTNVATVSMSGDIITITPKNVSGTATITVKSAKTEEYNEKSAIYMANVYDNTYVTSEQIAATIEASPTTYYGAKVSNYTKGGTYRIFYVDTENKYGDGRNTIYLIADFDDNRTTGSNANYEPTKTKVRIMNKEWATNRGSDESSWNPNEKMVAYLCDTSKWMDYYDEEKANYAIACPSLEMYVDSYNKTHITNNLVYRYQTYGWQAAVIPGYGVGVNGNYIYNGWYTVDNAVDTAQNGIYMVSDMFFKLASPSTIDYQRTVDVRGSNASIGNGGISYTSKIRPLVSLKLDTPIKIEM